MTTNIGFGYITPYFTLSEPELFIFFCSVVFKSTILKCDKDSSKKIKHARLKIGNSIVMINQENKKYKSNQSQMHIEVKNIDLCYKLALDNGAINIMTPNIRDHGSKMAGIIDPCNNIWWLSEAIK